MHKHSETRFLPYTPQQLYALVADIERYPDFLPWCAGARILERGPDFVKADLIVGYKAIREKFTSLVRLEAGRRIDVTYVSGPFRQMQNEWRFEPAPGGCNLSFALEFSFKNAMLSSLLELFFEQALKRMAAAFEARARALYG